MKKAAKKISDKRVKYSESHEETVDELKKLKPRMLGIKGSKGMKMGIVVSGIK